MALTKTGHIKAEMTFYAWKQYKLAIMDMVINYFFFFEKESSIFPKERWLFQALITEKITSYTVLKLGRVCSLTRLQSGCF